MRVAAPAVALAATLALAGCGARNGTSGPTPTTPAAAPVGQVVDQDTLDRITGVLDDTDRVLDAVDQEIAADPQE